MLLDPDITWYTGLQYPNGKENFGVFLDSMPDTWGRNLMKKRAAQKAKEEGKPAQTLYDIDYLLEVADESRMGALRFKLDAKCPFLDNNLLHPTPPMTSIRELQYAVNSPHSSRIIVNIDKFLRRNTRVPFCRHILL